MSSFSESPLEAGETEPVPKLLVLTRWVFLVSLALGFGGLESCHGIVKKNLEVPVPLDHRWNEGLVRDE